MVTRCPARTTCSENLLSLTGYGCCIEPDAVRCPDSWHCCPRGSHCSTDCNFRSCKCIFLSSRPVALKSQNEENKNGEKERKVKPQSHPESHSVDVKPGLPVKPSVPLNSSVPVKPGKPVKLAKQVKNQEGIPKSGKKHKKVKPREGHGRKESRKTEKNKKQKSKLSRKKAQKNHKNEHHRNKKGNKKHKKQRRKKERKMDHKSKSKAKDRGTKTKKLSSSKAIKAIQNMSKHVVKAHATHRKTNYHPTVKQHWVTRFTNGLGITKKHKPNIKFAHTWGERKHQDLSYKPFGKKKKIIEKENSMTEELKHLIVKHRKETLRARLKLALPGAHSDRENRVNNHSKLRKFKNVKLKSTHSTNLRNKKVWAQKFTHEVKIVSKAKNKPRKLKIKKGKLTHSAESQSILKHRNLKGKKVLDHEEKLVSGNHEAVNELEFNNLRQTLQEKELARENHLQKFNSAKSNENGFERTPNKPSQNEILNKNITEKQSEKLRNVADDSSLRDESTLGSAEQFQYNMFTETMSTNINTEGKNTSTNLDGSSFSDSFGSNEFDVGSTDGGVSHDFLSKTKMLSSVKGKQRANPSLHFKPLATHSGLNETVLRENQTKLQSYGKDEKGKKPNKQELAKTGVKNASNSSIDLILTSGNNAKIDEVFIGNGFEGSESAFGLVASSSRMGDYYESGKGEDLTEPMGRYARTDGVGSSSEFDVDELLIGSAGGFVDPSPVVSDNYDDLRHTVSGDDVTRQTVKKDRTDLVVSSRGFQSYIETRNGFNSPPSFGSYYQDSNNGQDVTRQGGDIAKTDTVDGKGGLEGNSDLSFVSASGIEALFSHSGTYRGPNNVVSGGGFEFDDSSIGSASGRHNSDDSNRDQHVMKILQEEEKESSSNRFEERGIAKNQHSEDISTTRSADNGPNLATEPSINKTLESDSHYITTSGTNVENFSENSGNDPHFGGEDDDEEERYVEDDNFGPAGEDDVYSGLLPSSGTISYNSKPKNVGNPQNVLHQYKANVSEGSSKDISQMRYGGWDDVEDSNDRFESGYESSIEWESREYGSSEGLVSRDQNMLLHKIFPSFSNNDSGFEGGRYEPNTQWDGGQYGSSENFATDSLSSNDQYNPLSDYAIDSSNVANNVYLNSSSLDGEHGNMDDMGVERRSIVRELMSGNHKHHQEQIMNTKPPRENLAGKNKPTERNRHLLWKEKELEQLSNWLTTKRENNSKQTIVSGGKRNDSKNMQSSHKIPSISKSPSRYSKIPNMLMKKIFPNFSES